MVLGFLVTWITIRSGPQNGQPVGQILSRTRAIYYYTKLNNVEGKSVRGRSIIKWHQPLESHSMVFPLRGLIGFVDEALDPSLGILSLGRLQRETLDLCIDDQFSVIGLIYASGHTVAGSALFKNPEFDTLTIFMTFTCSIRRSMETHALFNSELP